ncbi:MAG: sulfoxide reductase heme-binding subunit YedZ [Chloroflexota bacterium]
MKFKFTKFQIFVHLSALVPLAVLIWDYSHNNLTFNPIQEATLRTGKTALTLLLLSLAATPANSIFGFRQAIKVRRPLGVYSFMYALIHFLIFVLVDYNFSWPLIKEAIFEKRYALIGFSAFLILLPLALTSTKGWQKRMGKKWKSLHKWVYVAGLLVIVHFVWLVKSDYREPLVYGAIIIMLLVLRLPTVKKYFRDRGTNKLFRGKA